MPRKILVALELDDLSASTVLAKAKAQCEEDDRCEILHVVDPTSIAYSIDPTLSGTYQKEFQESAIKNAEARLSELAAPHALPNASYRVEIGRIPKVIHELITNEGFDCLMIGSHGWHGWQRLLGTHASRIVTQAHVDAWVFKIPSADH